MRMPYNCYYCGMTSMRRGNVNAHIQRKHSDKYNPFLDMKQKQSDCNFSKPKKPEPSNFPSPQRDVSDPTQYFEGPRKFENVLQEIRQWNKIELDLLVLAIINLPNYRNYSNSLF